MHERVVMKSVWIILYLLLICTLNQVHYGQNSKEPLVLSDLDTLKEASSQNKPFAQAVLALAYVHGDKVLIFQWKMPTTGKDFRRFGHG